MVKSGVDGVWTDTPETVNLNIHWWFRTRP